MEDILRFDGGLNLAQGNLPEEDYGDANNIVISEDLGGDAGVIKKIQDILPFLDFSNLGVEALCSTSDFEGNQYILGGGTISLTAAFAITPSEFNEGDIVSQSNGAAGVVSSIGGTAVTIRVTSSGFTPGLALNNDTTGGSSALSTVTNFSRPNSASLFKVDPSGSVTLLMCYNPDEAPTIEDPSIIILGTTLVFNYMKDGELLSWDLGRTYKYFGGDINILDVSFIKKQPNQLLVNEVLTGGEPLDIFSNNSITLAARYVYDNGEVSALSGYSHFIANPDRTDENRGLDGVVSLSVNAQPPHPRYAEKIQFYARIGNGPFRRAETRDILDSTLNVGIGFTGQLSEALSTNESNKLFDAVPINTKALEVSKNRIFTGNITDDLADENANAAFAFILTNNSSEYLPGSEPNDIDTPFFYAKGSSTDLVQDAVTAGNFIQERFVLSNDSLYNIGIAFYDEYYRTRGVVPSSVRSVKTGLFSTPNRIQSLSVSSSQIPSWAKYYRVLMTRNLSKDFSIESYANSIFYQLEDEDGNLYFGNFASEGDVIDSVVIESNISYTFQEGDKVNLFVDGNIEQLNIKSVINSRIFCEPSVNSGRPYFSAKNKYFEIFSPKDITAEDSTIFYETEEWGEVSDLPETISNPRIYDQTLIKDKIESPVFSETIDGDTLYHFDGEGSPRELSGLPVRTSGALLFSESDFSANTVITGSEGTANLIDWNGLHTNDHALLISDVRWHSNPSHGYAEGEVQPVSGQSYSEEILRVIDSDTYYSSLPLRELTVADSSGFAVGDAVVLSNTISNVNARVLEIPNGTTIRIGSLTYDESRRAASTYNSITNGVSTQSITAFSSFIAPSAPGIRSFFSEEKVYVGDKISIENSGESVDYPWNIPEAFSNDLIRFDDFSTIAFPAKTGNAKLEYYLSIDNNSGSEQATVFIVNNDASQSNLQVGTIPVSGSAVFSGSIDVTLSPTVVKSFALVVTSTTAGNSLTINEGSYIYGVLNEDLEESVISSDKKEEWGLSRKPNRRESDDFTWDLLQGKPSLVDTGIDSRVLDNKIRYGERFIEDSIINPISSFDSSASDFVSFESGPITQLVRTNKLDAIGTVVLAICERETNSIYIGERLVTNNDGSTSLAISDNVIGSIQPLQGSRGTKHRRSIAKDQNGTVVWWDDFNKDICRYTREGVVPISDFKVKPYFQPKSGGFVSFYDKFYDMFFFHHIASGETIGYSQQFRWVGLYDMTFTLGGEQFDEKAFPINGGVIYDTLNSTSNGDYFGVSGNTAEITLSRFDQINFEPRFMRIRGDNLDSENFNIELTNERNQRTTLSQDFFTRDNSYVYSDVYRDENDQGLYTGIPLQSSRLDAKMILTGDVAFREIYLGYEPLTY